MKHIHRLLGLLLLLLAGAGQAYASHNLGGELTYKYMGNNKYQFTLYYYRDCTGGPSSDPTVTLNLSTSTGGGIATLNASYTMNRIKISEISPECNPLPGSNKPQQINCLLPANSGNGPSPGTVEKNVYVSGLIDFSGVPAPPVGGYIFYVDYSCCRNTNDNATNCSSLSFRAIMYRYLNNAGVPLTPVQMGFRDSSPTFLEPPTTLLIQSTTDTFCFNNNGSDPDLDSLAYDFAYPWSAFNTPCNYTAPYTLANPIPGLLPNTPTSPNPDPISGAICFRPNLAGNYLTCFRIRAYRCGQLISEIYRDFESRVLVPPTNYGVNNRPQINIPFTANGVSGGAGSFQGTFEAGDVIDFDIAAGDNDGYNPGTIGFFQNLDVYLTGTEFGTNYTSQTTGCPYPPCATLSDPNTGAAPIPILLRNDTLGYGFSGNTAASPVLAHFHWNTSCDNLPLNACGVLKNTYSFTVTSKDDYCPVNGKIIQPILITIVPSKQMLNPAPVCVVVNPNGSITLNWTAPPNPRGNFARYVIFRKTSITGTFAPYDSINNYATTTWTDPNANAYTGVFVYLIKTRSGCYEQYNLLSRQDVVQPMILSMTQNPAGAALTWNNPHNFTPAADTFPATIRVLQSVAHGPFQVVRAGLPKNTTTFFDSLSVCNDSVFFRVEYVDTDGNCFSASTVTGGHFMDPSNVSQAVILNVSADTTLGGKGLVINWAPNPDGDTRGYLLYRFDCGSTAIQQQWNLLGRFNNSFRDTTVDNATTTYCYGLAAYDSCFTDTAPGNLSLIHHNIVLGVEQNRCAANNVLTWNDYDGYASGISYDILRQEDSTAGAFVVRGTVNSGIKTFTDTGLVNNRNYCYLIRANDAASTTTPQNNAISNRVCIHSKVVTEPLFSYIRYASVDSDKTVRVGWLVDTAADVKHYRVERATNGVDFAEQAQLPPRPFMLTPLPTVEYVDRSADVELETYTYRVVVVDSCDRDALVSQNTATTVRQDAAAKYDNTNALKWTPYVGWPNGVAYYIVLRTVTGVDQFGRPTQTVVADTLSTSDDITAYLESQGNFCYQILAVENGPNAFGLTDTASSNRICVDQAAKLFTPNAFVPGGTNTIFIPKAVFAQDAGYTLTIFNRWGSQLFTSNNWDQGWDGLVNGKDAEMGIYMWKINFKGKDGHNYEQNGSLTLIR